MLNKTFSVICKLSAVSRGMMQFFESFSSFWTHNTHLVTLGNLHDFQLHRKRSKLKTKFLVCQSPMGASPSASEKRWRPTKKSLESQCRTRKKTKKLLCFSSMHNDDSQASNAWSNKPSPVVHLVVDSSGLGLLSWRSSAATCHLLHSQSSYLIKLMNPSKESWDRRRKWEKKKKERKASIKYDLGYFGP